MVLQYHHFGVLRGEKTNKQNITTLVRIIVLSAFFCSMCKLATMVFSYIDLKNHKPYFSKDRSILATNNDQLIQLHTSQSLHKSWLTLSLNSDLKESGFAFNSFVSVSKFIFLLFCLWLPLVLYCTVNTYLRSRAGYRWVYCGQHCRRFAVVQLLQLWSTWSSWF